MICFCMVCGARIDGKADALIEALKQKIQEENPGMSIVFDDDFEVRIPCDGCKDSLSL